MHASVTDLAAPGDSLSDRTVATARRVLSGGHSGRFSYLAFAGPAVVASIAYMDPGNFATNIQAGAKYGYSLLWVVLLANLIAMLFQALSAKLGIVTGRNLAELCREHFPRPVVWVMWIISEVGAMATDLAEFLGGAIGLSLLFGMPLLAGMGVTALVTYGLLMFERFGFRPLELIIGAIVGLICACYLVEMFIAPVDWAAAAFGTVRPQIADGEARDTLKIALAPGGPLAHLADSVVVNRRLYDSTGTKYTIPDLRIPGEGVIIDGTIGYKDNKTEQVKNFFDYGSKTTPKTNTVIIVTPNNPQAYLRPKGP